ncbi:MAG TPA: flagellar motor protein [Acidimicrobiales bacterium]|nr:flagellar motor protein [Acidimicrobiales bacterium]
MDIASAAGVGLAFAAVLLSMIMDGGNPAALVSQPAAIILVVGGTLGATIAGYELKDVTGIAKVFLKAFMPGPPIEATESIEQVVHFADRARRDGLLALEEEAKNIEDPFLQKGLQLAIDGTDPEVVRDVLETEIAALKERHKFGAKFFADMGAFAPTLGIIGTVLGLVHMLENLSDPSSMGPLISAAFIATLWGVMTANLIYLPISNKLKRASAEEVHHKELILEGVLAIQAGANPRTVTEKLKSYLPPAERDEIGDEKQSA